jgi:hypothetical protein
LLKTIIYIALVGFAIMYAVSWLAWRLGGRDIAVSLGLIPWTAYDYLVIGWKAERAGQWADALTAYDEAIRLDPENSEAHARRRDLLERQPDPGTPGE